MQSRVLLQQTVGRRFSCVFMFGVCDVYNGAIFLVSVRACVVGPAYSHLALYGLFLCTHYHS